MILQECATGLRRPPGVKYAGYKYKILLACAEDVPTEHSGELRVIEVEACLYSIQL